MDLSCDYLKMKHPIAQKALYALLEVKDSDLRLDTVYQGNHAVDQGIHIGGTFSELIPLIALFYGGFIHVNVEDPTARESDIYVQSKGHGIAGMASVFSDFGFFDRALLENSRGSDSDLNGHPGPILPGVHIATGPLGQGISAAVGFAMAQKIEGVGRTFCLMGDGELQEGIPWEAFMFASAKNLNNLCILIDHNYGQNDDSHRLMLSMGSLREKLESFGFDVLDVNGQEYEPIYHALEHFQHRIDSRPMAIISECRKGEGGFSKATESHKTTVGQDLAEWEIHQQTLRRETRIKNLCHFLQAAKVRAPEEYEQLLHWASKMGIDVQQDENGPVGVIRRYSQRRTKRAAPRDKTLHYQERDLPDPKIGDKLQCSKIAADMVAAFSRDPKMITLDADMGLISGLQPGMLKHAGNRGINVGIAESNMSGIAEAFAAKGYNVWHSTFGVFFDWRVLRRITVSQQERMESISKSDGWLSEGHQLDITLFSTASNIDTGVNGATHMSIDDVTALMQLVTIQLLQGLGLEGATQVPYDSGADAITAIMGNHVDVSFMQVGDLGSAVESGNVKPLLIVDEKRCEIYPDIPCTEELGIEATGAQYRAFFATKDTTPEQIQYLNDKMADLQDDPDYLEALEGFGFLPGFIPADEMGAKIEEWYNIFAPIYEEYLK